MSVTIDLHGRRIGRLTVESISSRNPMRWQCLCDCGTRKVIRAAMLNRPNRTESCGCLHREWVGNMSRTHGLSKTPLYRLWAAIKQRCYSPENTAYLNYGGRGIHMQASWIDDGEQFIKDILSAIGPRPSKSHSIDRIDTNGHYEVGNIRWATMTQQAHNKRNNNWLELNGRRLVITEWARVTGLAAPVIRHRLDTLGWSVERALTTPLMRRMPKRRHG